MNGRREKKKKTTENERRMRREAGMRGGKGFWGGRGERAGVGTGEPRAAEPTRNGARAELRAESDKLHTGARRLGRD